MTSIWWIGLILSFVVGIVYSSIFEWVLHRYVMHKPFKILGFTFTYAFKAHAIVHHEQFRSDESYEAEPGEERVGKIPMAWWNGVTLVLVGSIPFAIISYLTGPWNILIGISVAMLCYYGAYEYIHYCFHLPKDRFWERTRIFKFLNKHHKIHHEQMGKNFNVVLPLADFLLGSLSLSLKRP